MEVNIPRLNIRDRPISPVARPFPGADLQMPPLPPSEMKLAKQKMDELFVHWLTQRETGELLARLVGQCPR